MDVCLKGGLSVLTLLIVFASFNHPRMFVCGFGFIAETLLDQWF